MEAILRTKTECNCWKSTSTSLLHKSRDVVRIVNPLNIRILVPCPDLLSKVSESVAWQQHTNETKHFPLNPHFPRYLIVVGTNFSIPRWFCCYFIHIPMWVGGWLVEFSKAQTESEIWIKAVSHTSHNNNTLALAAISNHDAAIAVRSLGSDFFADVCDIIRNVNNNII